MTPPTSSPRPLSVALIGGEAAGRQALKALLDREIEVALVCPSGPGGEALAALATEHGCRVVDAGGVGTGAVTEAILGHEVDLLLNIHSLHILGSDLLDAARIGSFNLHPGPLPAYGGLGAPSWAVFNGETRYAVTLHWMTAGIDAGHIAYEHWFELDDTATGLTVSTQCAKHGLALVNRLIDQAMADPSAIPRTPQGPGTRRLYRRSEIPFDGIVDWSRPAQLLNRLVRASSYRPFPSPWGDRELVVDGEVVGLVATSVVADPDLPERPAGERQRPVPGTVVALDGGAVGIVTGDGTLRIDRLQRDGRPVAPTEVLRPGQCVVGANGGPTPADRERGRSISAS